MRARLGVETLEDRTLPSATVVNGTLQVVARDIADHIILRLQAGHPNLLEMIETRIGANKVSLFDRNTFSAIVVDGGDGDDTIELDASNGDWTNDEQTTLKGGKGNDRLDARGTGDPFQQQGVELDGGEDDDELFGSDGPDRLIAGAGDNHLEGGNGFDTYVLRTLRVEKDEVFENDTFFNRLDFQLANRPVTVDLNLNTGQTQVTSGNNSKLILTGNVRAVIGSPFGDHLSGTGEHDNLRGGPGDDVIDGRGDNGDLLIGDSGSDTLIGGNGDTNYQVQPGGTDVIEDTGGADRLSIVKASANIALDLSQSTGQVQPWTDAGTLAITGTIEDVLGAFDFKNTILGNTANNHLIGGNKKDVLKGGDGEDTLDGGPGNDNLFGQDDDDLLNGENGDDKLFGGAGDDRLEGRAGDDILLGGPGDDVLSGGTGMNVVF